LSVAGAISFVLGSLLLFSPFSPAMPAMPQVSVNPWLVTGMTACLVGFFGFAVAAGIRAQKKAVLVGAHVLAGKTGVALSDLSPQGIVQVESEMWSAIAAEGPLGKDTICVRAGETVEVIGRDGLRLRVRRKS
jgi:membrane-bound serine protease (ClpP class)